MRGVAPRPATWDGRTPWSVVATKLGHEDSSESREGFSMLLGFIASHAVRGCGSGVFFQMLERTSSLKYGPFVRYPK